MSRAFGDRQFKRSGLSALPDVQAFQLGPREAFLLLACDGFWGKGPGSYNIFENLVHPAMSPGMNRTT